MQQVQSLGQEGPLEEERVTHSSVFVWKVPWAEEPGGLQSMGSEMDMTYQLSTQIVVDFQPHFPLGSLEGFLCNGLV